MNKKGGSYSNNVAKAQAGCTPYDCSYNECDPNVSAVWHPTCEQGNDKYGTPGRRNSYHPSNRQCLNWWVGGCVATPIPIQTANACVGDPNEITWNNNGGAWCSWIPNNGWTSYGPVAGPNLTCPMPMLGLSGSRPQILATIDRMSPVVGATHNDVGLRWGLRALSPRSQWEHFFGNTGHAPRNYGPANGKKAIILITDGENSESRDFPGYWGCSDTNVPGCAGSVNTNTLNTRMLEWCTAIREDYEIELYTVAVNVNNPTALNLLRQCAGSADHAFAGDASQLRASLDAISSSIFSLHIKE